MPIVLFPMQTNTAAIELFLLAIGALLSVISVLGGIITYFGRQYIKRIISGLEEMREENQQVKKIAHTNAELLLGSEGTPWEGFNSEIKKSRTSIISNQKAIKENQERIKRNANALRREGMLDPQMDMSTRPNNLPDIDEINNTHDDSK